MNFRFLFFPDEDPASEAARRLGAAQNGSGPPYEIRDGGFVRRTGEDRIVPVANFTARIEREVLIDNGARETVRLGLAADFRDRRYTFTLSAAEFARMGWVLAELGPHAIVYPGQQQHARAAIQHFSAEIARERRYGHTGWRHVAGEWVYLDSMGAIGRNGRVEGIGVELPRRLRGYELAVPGDREAALGAVAASLELIDVAPDRVSIPLLAAVYRAALGQADFSLYLAGPTGVFKSALAALAQQHFGAGMHAGALPANFSSTANALELVAYYAKDALLVVDDFAPSGTAADARLEGVAERLFRGAGNRQGRGRLRFAGVLEQEFAPRALVVATGEDLPAGHSVRARLLILEVASGDVRTDVLSGCQRAASGGLLSAALSEFVRSVATGYERTQTEFLARKLELRTRRAASGLHGRTASAVADLDAAFEIFLAFAREIGVLTGETASALAERGRAAFDQLATAQANHQEAADPALRFLALLRAAVRDGAAHIADREGGPPPRPADWGWSPAPEAWRPSGVRVGWMDGEDLYLDPQASYRVAQSLAGRDRLAVSERGVRIRLKQRGLLASVDGARQTSKIRRTLAGRLREVLHLASSTFR